MISLILKLLLAPGFVIAASLCVRRWGPQVGGIVGGLPVVAGPILLVLAIDRGARFTGSAAAGTLLGLISLMAFVGVYAAGCRRVPWWLLAPLGWGAFAASTALLDQVRLGPGWGLVIVYAVFLVALRLIPSPPGQAGPSAPPRWDLPLRAGCAAAMVLVLTGVSGSLGPHLSGLVAAFPIITTVLAAFTHVRAGSDATRRLLHGMTRGFFAYGAFCAIVAAMTRPAGTPAAFLTAVAVALLIGALTLVGRRREVASAAA